MSVTELDLGQSLRASEVPLSGSMRLITPPDTIISHVVAVRAVEEEAAPVEAVPAATAAEPEVIKKGKKEEEAAPDKKEEKKKK